MEENHARNQNWPIDQVVKKMKLREYSNPTEN